MFALQTIPQHQKIWMDIYMIILGCYIRFLLLQKYQKKNGWRTQNRWYYYLDVAEGFISYIGIDFKHKSNKSHLYVEIDGNNMVEIQYCHELQHLLFGLGLNSEMEVQVWHVEVVQVVLDASIQNIITIAQEIWTVNSKVI